MSRPVMDTDERLALLAEALGELAAVVDWFYDASRGGQVLTRAGLAEVRRRRDEALVKAGRALGESARQMNLRSCA